VSDFVFCLCAPGAEATLKKEVQDRGLAWSPSYQRPGFVTFKREDKLLPELTWARARSVSLGRWTAPFTLDNFIYPGTPDLLRVSARDEADQVMAQQLAQTLGASLKKPQLGQNIAEVVVVGPEEVWVGGHTHDSTHAIYPGGVGPPLTPQAPSRAHAKLEAVLAWWGEMPQKDEWALELGSAPGGASWVLLNQGLWVTGVDPGAMDEKILRHPHYRHISASINILTRADFAQRVDWLLADMNVTPQLTLKSARRVIEAAWPKPRALVLTLKLKSWSLATQLPDWCALVREWGYSEVRAKQLWPHRQELVLVAKK